MPSRLLNNTRIGTYDYIDENLIHAHPFEANPVVLQCTSSTTKRLKCSPWIIPLWRLFGSVLARVLASPGLVK
ncbi:hypothetical protein K432DRAFT_377549 [Lepidopterella palustris CBS 459.81]|uniref:Uncharacterized protein n=1 Tax=Lepidopterella palustris CBS 459.81 TaxID=1314670 RepID=A0A8E2EKL4_9PEZI|nr:hypothetical protein K432DRAFT_377549 [Lepidopterella palustris CBS 459.81]